MKNNFKVILGARLKTLRGHISQSQMAAAIGIPQQTYANWELGIRQPKLDDLATLSLHFGVSSDFLLGLTDDSGSLRDNDRKNLEARVSELEAKLHDSEVSIRTLRETILEGNAAQSFSPSSSSSRSMIKQKALQGNK